MANLSGGPRPTGALIGSALLLTVLCRPMAASVQQPVYRIAVSDDLRVVQVEARLPEDTVSLTSHTGRIRKMQELRSCDEAPLPTQRNRIFTETAGGCLRYRYPLRSRTGRRSPAVAPGVLLSSPGEWLWTPRLAPGSRLLIELSLPEGAAVSVPWKPVSPGTFELTASPESATATAVFGKFAAHVLHLGDARLRVAMLNGPDRQLDTGRVMDWLEVAAADVAAVGGRFPNSDLQVIVQPVAGGGRSPVPFGYVARNGGESVRFFVDSERSLEDLHQDWTATHEFSHLLLPYVASADKWVSEGFASYYQNVLLARRGVYSPGEAWNRLHRGFRKADRVHRPPPLSRLDSRPFRDVRMLIYWSGAAMALEADVRLRSMGSSLDEVLGRFAACCLPSERTWSGTELFSRLDSLSPHPVFLPLYRSYAGRRGMPDLSPLYADLGLIPNGEGSVELAAEGRLSAVRDAIMGTAY